MDTVDKLTELTHKFQETVMQTIAVKKKFKTLKKKTSKAKSDSRKRIIK